MNVWNFERAANLIIELQKKQNSISSYLFTPILISSSESEFLDRRMLDQD
jgi:hypothetical protein